ncbi:hypothetical protein ACO2Q8_28925 [Larkinella sp. VNQ87]|uniref:hypothetical protein n=1 Tax=Larkinella sp. VNQ87 TaxID=3400921 RepID=UPI003C0C1DC0
MKVDVVVQNLEGSKITVRLVDQSGITQATQYLSKDEKAIRTRFDISGLPDGLYRVVVSDGKNTQTRAINLATHVPTPVSFRTISVG